MKNTKRKIIAISIIAVLIVIPLAILLISCNSEKNMYANSNNNALATNKVTENRGTIINVPIDSRPISRSNFQYLAEAAGYEYAEISSGLDSMNSSGEYQAGNSETTRTKTSSEMSKYNKIGNRAIINLSSYFFGGLIAARGDTAYDNRTEKIKELSTLISSNSKIRYYVIANVPRTLPDSRILEYPVSKEKNSTGQKLTESSKVKGLADYYKGTDAATTTFDQAVLEWLYVKYWKDIDGNQYSELPTYVKTFCEEFYNDKYGDFLAKYYKVFTESYAYIEQLLPLQSELAANGIASIDLIVTIDDNTIADFIKNNASKTSDANFSFIKKDKSGNAVKIGPSYVMEEYLKDKSATVMPGTDELNYMILAKDLVDKTNVGVNFTYLNPVTNSSISNSDLNWIGKYDTATVKENLEIREDFINKGVKTKLNADVYITGCKARYEGGTELTSEEADQAAENIYKSKNPKSLIGIAYFDENLLSSLVSKGNIYDLMYTGSNVTIGVSAGIGLASTVVGTLMNDEFSSTTEASKAVQSRIKAFTQYKLISNIEGAVYNNHKGSLSESNSQLAKRISYVGGDGSTGGANLLEELTKDGATKNHVYTIGGLKYTISDASITATRPWNRLYETKISPELTVNMYTESKKEVKVYHYKENLDGTYNDRPDETDKIETKEETITPETKTYEGFSSPEKETVTVNEEGTTEVKYYYTRNSYEITLVEAQNVENVKGIDTYKFGETVTLSAEAKSGYGEIHWTVDEASKTGNSVKFEMPAKAIEVYVTAGETTEYSITYELNGGKDPGNPTKYTVDTETIKLKSPTRTGYKFLGWTGEGITTPTKDIEIEKGATGNRKYTANWEEEKAETGEITYQVEHYKQKIDGSYNSKADETETLKTKETKVTPKTKTYEGFTSPSSEEVTVLQNGTTKVTYYYTRNSYEVILKTSTGVQNVEGIDTYKYGEEVKLSAQAKTGSGKIKWTIDGKSQTSDTVKFTMPAKDVEVSVKVEENKYNITYNLDGGIEPGNPSTYTSDTETIKLKSPIRVNYKFLGWTSDEITTPTIDVEIAKGSTGDKEFTANWELNSEDKLEVVINYSENGPTSNDVKVQIIANSKLKELDGWELSTEGNILEKVFSKNGKEKVTIESESGKKEEFEININNIDKTAPTLDIEYKYDKSKNVVNVEITSSEELQEIDGWSTTDNLKFTKKYSSNTKEKVIFKDLAGNETEITVEVNQITDESEVKDPEDEQKPDDDNTGTNQKPNNESNNNNGNNTNNKKEESVQKEAEKDNTITSEKVLPKTGSDLIIKGVILLGIVVAIVLLLKYKKYKNILK